MKPIIRLIFKRKHHFKNGLTLNGINIDINENVTSQTLKNVFNKKTKPLPKCRNKSLNSVFYESLIW